MPDPLDSRDERRRVSLTTLICLACYRRTISMTETLKPDPKRPEATCSICGRRTNYGLRKLEGAIGPEKSEEG